MKTRKVTLAGVELDVKFNMGVQIAYEEIIGEPFDLNEVGKTTKNRAALYSAALVASNPDAPIDMATEIMKADFEELAAIDKAVAEAMEEFFKPVVGMPKPKEGTSQKN